MGEERELPILKIRDGEGARSIWNRARARLRTLGQHEEADRLDDMQSSIPWHKDTKNFNNTGVARLMVLQLIERYFKMV